MNETKRPSVSLERWALGAGPEGHMVLLHRVCRVQIDAPDTVAELHALINMHVCPAKKGSLPPVCKLPACGCSGEAHP